MQNINWYSSLTRYCHGIVMTLALWGQFKSFRYGLIQTSLSFIRQSYIMLNIFLTFDRIRTKWQKLAVWKSLLKTHTRTRLHTHTHARMHEGWRNVVDVLLNPWPVYVQHIETWFCRKGFGIKISGTAKGKQIIKQKRPSSSISAKLRCCHKRPS